MKQMHSLLRRQLKRFFGDIESAPTEVRELINAVNSAYHEFDMERGMLERSLDLSSQELLQANSELRSVFHALPDMVFIIDGKGIILDHKFGTMVDMYHPVVGKKLIGKPIQSIPIPGVSRKFKEALGQVQQENAVISIEYDLTIGGMKNYYEARLAPVMENRFIVIVRNITERVLADENLRKERDFTNTLVQSSPAFICALNIRGRVVMMNNAMLNSLGYAPEEVQGRDYLSTFIPEKDRKVVGDIFEKLMKYRHHLVQEGDILTKAGEKLLVEWHMRPILKDEPVDLFLGVGIDVTGRRHLENQLRQAQKMEAIGTLAGGVAHDFNNLLMGIQGRTSLMLMETRPSNPHYEHLCGIEDYVKSATGLTRQLLGFARGGKYEVKPRDLNEIIRKSSDMFGRTRKEMAIHTHFHGELWTVEVDQGQIEQVLLNLFLNAGQAMPGGGDLFIRTDNVILDEEYVMPYGVKPGRYVKLSVTDTGMGMDKGTMDRIFDPFFTTKGLGRGTGLGLPSAYGIVKNHDGIINVYSEKGKGSTFTIYLPVSGRAVSKDAMPREDLTRGSGSVLLVDDEEMILAVGKRMIEALGYTVSAARSGRQAQALYQEKPGAFDLVVLDMIMPDMSGHETFMVLREVNPGIKVLLSSGYSLEGQAEELLRLGCKSFIQKPFSMKELSEKLQCVLADDCQPF